MTSSRDTRHRLRWVLGVPAVLVVGVGLVLHHLVPGLVAAVLLLGLFLLVLGGPFLLVAGGIAALAAQMGRRDGSS